ncbi:MAG: sigma-70 family RNA polymerase sigma factor [Phycisphaerales bacterium]|nr:MAG: sigma-70 family RNA polymerase sigma factor [Phycisphaerales bacterium]
MSDVTQILNAIERGDRKASADLLPVVYEELRLLATQRLSGEPPGQTLQATALVHEAYIRLVGADARGWESRAHFFAAAAEAMRRVVIDRARRRLAGRRGGGWCRVALETIDAPAQADEDVLMRVHAALEALALDDARAAELVKLRFFAGLGVEEAALAMGVTDRTARRYWRFARAWLYDRLSREES